MTSSDHSDPEKSRLITAAVIFWSRELQCYIAAAPAYQGAVGTGDYLVEALRDLEETITQISLASEAALNRLEAQAEARAPALPQKF